MEKNREHWKVYLKRVTPIFGAYKTITISVLAFLLVSGCALLYLHPGDHELMMELLMFLIVGPACISPLMELVEFGADLRNLAVRMDQIDEVLNMQPISEGTETAPKVKAEIVFQDVSFSYQNAADPLRRMAAGSSDNKNSCRELRRAGRTIRGRKIHGRATHRPLLGCGERIYHHRWT